jgi:hypothetical protein
MMGREEDNLGEMGLSNLARARPNNLCRAGPSSIGVVELIKICKKRQSGSRGSKHSTKMNLFFLEGVSFVSIKLL